MRRQIWRVIIALGCLAGLSGPAMASPFTCTPGSFLSSVSIPNTDLSGFTGPYGEICVTLTDSTHAVIQAETFSGFLMGDGSTVALQVNATSFTASTPTGGNASSYTLNYFPIPPVDGHGHFDFVVDSSDGFGQSSSFLTFMLTNNSATWAAVTDVLTGNDHTPPYDAAMHIFVDCGEDAACGGGFAAEAAGSVVAQPAPEPAMLSLLAIGLLAMGLPALRRRMA